MQTIVRTVLAILLAHLLADFPLQSDAIALGKKSHKFAYVKHGAIHLITLLVLLQLFTDVSLWTTRTLLLVLLYVVLHIAIDTAKNWLVNRRTGRDSIMFFLIDQALHVAAVMALAWLFTGYRWKDVQTLMDWSDKRQLQVLTISVLYVAVIFGGGYLVRYLTRSLTVPLRSEDGNQEELRNAGLYIGWLERFLVLTALVVQSPALIGLILTGKSIARLPELKGPRFAEYFLIGTFLSISLALLGGILLSRFLFGTGSFK